MFLFNLTEDSIWHIVSASYVSAIIIVVHLNFLYGQRQLENKRKEVKSYTDTLNILAEVEVFLIIYLEWS